jgi:hypothetical protein
MVRMAKGAAEVPARIAWERTEHEPGDPSNLMDRSPILTARINGELVAVDEVWLRRGRAIDQAEYDFQLADVAWARQHAPSDPKANHRDPVDLTSAPPLF